MIVSKITFKSAFLLTIKKDLMSYFTKTIPKLIKEFKIKSCKFSINLLVPCIIFQLSNYKNLI